MVKWITGFETEEITLEGDATTTEFWTSSADKLHDGMTKDEAEEFAMPAGVTSIFDKLIMGIRAIAAFVMIIALVWGGIKLEARDPPKSQRIRRTTDPKTYSTVRE